MNPELIQIRWEVSLAEWVALCEMARDNGYDDMIAFVRHVIEEVTRSDQDGPEI